MGSIDTIKRIIAFLREDIWRIHLDDFSRLRRFLLGQLRIVVLSVRGFREDQCHVRASALTYYTLLSIVPVAAIALGIAKGFGYDRVLQRILIESYPGYETLTGRLVEYSSALLENTQGGIVAGFGLLFLLWTLIKVLGNIEGAFNDIWNVGKQRSLVRKFSDYIAIVLVCTIGLLIYNSATVFIAAHIQYLFNKLALSGLQGPLVSLTFKAIPFLLIWTLFAFIYIVMPNTRVGLRPALTAAVVAGTLYQVVQWGYITLQIGVARYNAIYGSLAAVPLFLVWLQISWLIVLFGAEISFAIQNVRLYQFEIDSLRVSWHEKKRLALLVAHRVIRGFSRGERAMTAAAIAEELGIPVRLVRNILAALAEAGVFSKTESPDERDVAYQPACDLEHFTVKCVLDTFEKIGSETVPVRDSPQLERLNAILDSFAEAIEHSPGNVLLRDIG